MTRIFVEDMILKTEKNTQFLEEGTFYRVVVDDQVTDIVYYVKSFESYIYQLISLVRKDVLEESNDPIEKQDFHEKIEKVSFS